jgi:hypothetical protein
MVREGGRTATRVPDAQAVSGALYEPPARRALSAS